MSTRSRLCVTVSGTTTAELRARRDAAVGTSGADIVELRLDGVADVRVSDVLANRPCPVIVTCRPTWEGGRFDGSELARQAVLVEALDQGAEYVDVEHRATFAAELIARTNGRRIVLSRHDFDGVPADLPGLARTMRETGAEVIKIAVTTTHLTDCIALLDLSSHTIPGKTVLIGMGPQGIATRVMAQRFGSAWTYAGTLTDIGQVDAGRLVNEFGFRRLSEATAVYALTGSPIGHSVSPAMHNAAFQAAGVDAVYLPLPAANADDFLAFSSAIGLRGASVTIPFKVPLFERLDDVDALAKQVGAINTVCFDGGRMMGTNTDVAGFLRPLVDRGVAVNGLRASILGSGGSARAVAVALHSAGAAVRIHGRNVARARDLVAKVTSASVGEWPPASDSWDLLVNCTPIGMYPKMDDTPLPFLPTTAGSAHATGRIVYDLVYNPQTTRLLRDAAQAGCRPIGGLEMLVAQAEEQFWLWTGTRPASGVMRAAAEARLAEFAIHENHVV